MATRIRLPEEKRAVRAQLLPCSVGFSGPAPVTAFLRARPGPDGELWASFRGRRLGGRERPLPHGYRGGVLQCGPPKSTERDLQEVTMTATFGAITEWEADSVPPPQGGLAQALQWGPLAQAIHCPVPDDSEEEAEP